MTIQERFADLLAGAPADGPAVIADGQTWGWGRLGEVSKSLDAALNGLGFGFGEGARVGVILENGPQGLALAAGIIATGRCLTTLSPLQPADRLSADIERSRLPVVVGSPQILDAEGVRAAITATGGRALSLAGDGTLTVEPAAEPAPGGPVAEPVRLAPGVAVEMFTSGTTGTPKRVRLTYHQLDTSLGSAGFGSRRGPDGEVALASGVTLISTSLVHIGGLWNALASLYAGRRTVLMERFTVAEWVEAVATHRPKATGLVPAAMRMVLDAKVPAEKLASLEVVTSGAAPCPPELAEAFFDTYGARVLITYGSTEFSGAVAGWTKPLHVEWWERKKGATGRPYPGVTLRVVDDQGAEVPVNTSGGLEIKAPQAPDGGLEFIRTTDRARIDADGFLWLEGRSDDAIVRGGFKVHPPVVKAALEAHPSVFEAAVTGLPHERLGAVPVAAVELRAGAPEPTPEELIALARTTLTPYEVPVEVRIVRELPRTAAMKVDKRGLLALFGVPSSDDDAATAANEPVAG